jgi:hypothetical protein
MSLPEAGLVRQAQAREIPRVNSLPQNVPEVFLKHAEFHRESITCENSYLLLLIQVLLP